MKIMVVGGGGREHAIIKKIKENPAVSEIFALPGKGALPPTPHAWISAPNTLKALPALPLKIK